VEEPVVAPVSSRDMAERPRGLYRTTGWAYVTDGIMAFDILESDYRRGGHRPDYDSLPSKQDYDAAEAVRKEHKENPPIVKK